MVADAMEGSRIDMLFIPRSLQHNYGMRSALSFCSLVFMKIGEL